MAKQVVTRFAPSPTGYLHIGSARTALFSWAYARKTGGKFLLRIEDTDRERSTEEAVQAILDGLGWLGLNWDGEPTMQFARASRHAEIAHELLARGQAYYCYCSPDELAQMREEARAAGKPPRYDGRWRDRDPSEAPQGVAPVIRIKAPQTGEIVVNDHVQGKVVFKAENLDDFIILRSDGTPTYMHAVVVDDHDMGVTHIIRGDDHLTNAARQIVIYNAMGWTVPEMAHIPLIHGPDGAKLSKRHGAQAVHEYAEMGYLPEAMRNYLARLGWSHGDDELFSDEQAIGWFGLEAINKAPARLDFDKLAHVNSHWIRLAEDERLAKLVLDQHLKNGHVLSEGDEQRLLQAMPFVKDRAKTVIELATQSAFVLQRRPLFLNDKIRASLLDETGERMARLLERLRLFQSWDVFALESELKAFAEDEGVGFGKIGPPLRGALTAGSSSPDLARTLSSLGREESLGRLEDALSVAK